MKILIAGASGALGQRLVPMLVEAGHEVIGTTRSPGKVPRLYELGAEPLTLDVLDRDAVMAAIGKTQPEVVVHELTAISGQPDLRHFDRYFHATNRLRTEGLDNLLGAAVAVGARRFVAQSYTGWPNERTGGWVKTEDDPLDAQPSPNSRESLAAIQHVETAMLTAPGIEGVALRYGTFYGPGNALGRGGDMLEMIRRRKLPIVGGGTGVWSFIHIDDAARATQLAIDSTATGLFNIVDDEPAPAHQWLPYLADLIGVKAPMRVPAWLVRPVVGDFVISAMTVNRGSTNAKAKRELGWQPTYPSWRVGFRTIV